MNQRALQLEKLKKADEHYEEKMKLAEQERIEIIESARKTSRDLMKESEILAKAKAEAIMIQAHDGAMATLETGRRELEKERTTML
jgi:F0F1-type ATP synthase membrane subunit b/b'